MKIGTIVLVGICLLLAGCSKTEDEQMQEYIEFYYPTTGEFTYEILFDWGTYVITTGAGMDEELHPDSEPYKGYIVMRPSPKDESTAGAHLTYLITPDATVWTNGTADIADVNTREEVVTEKTEYGTSTQTTTIQSPLEPVVDHFKANKEAWTQYGVLEPAGAGYRLRKPAT